MKTLKSNNYDDLNNGRELVILKRDRKNDTKGSSKMTELNIVLCTQFERLCGIQSNYIRVSGDIECPFYISKKLVHNSDGNIGESITLSNDGTMRVLKGVSFHSRIIAGHKGALGEFIF
eukprot:UN25247